MSKIVEETNRYAKQCRRGTNKQWSTNAEEVWRLKTCQRSRDYWSTSKYFRSAPIADRISQDCFKEIMRYLHLLIIKHYQLIVKKNLPPSEGWASDVSPDGEVQECILPPLLMCHQWSRQGRSSINPVKPVKRGFKVCWLVNSMISQCVHRREGDVSRREGSA